MEKAMNDRLAHFARVDTPDTSTTAHVPVDLKPSEDSPADPGSPRSERGDPEDDLELIRALRLAELKRMSELEGQLRGLGHGEYTEIVENEFLDAVIKSSRAVVHFYHRDFARCKAVDKNLSIVAPAVIGARFLKINAEKCPFFIQKLNIKVLPTILYFVDGKTVHTVTGFSEFGGNEDFFISEFVKSLNRHGMLKDSRASAYDRWLKTSPKLRAAQGSDSEN